MFELKNNKTVITLPIEISKTFWWALALSFLAFIIYESYQSQMFTMSLIAIALIALPLLSICIAPIKIFRYLSQFLSWISLFFMFVFFCIFYNYNIFDIGVYANNFIIHLFKTGESNGNSVMVMTVTFICVYWVLQFLKYIYNWIAQFRIVKTNET